MSLFTRLLRPFSLRILIFFGFVLGVVPLAATLISAVHAVDELADLSQGVAVRVAQLSQKTENLRERLIDFERKAKRKLVLEDGDSRRDLAEAHRNFVDVAAELRGLVHDPDLKARFGALSEEGTELYQRLAEETRRTARVGGRHVRLSDADELFSALGGRMRTLARAVTEAAGAEVRALETGSEEVQRRLLARTWVWLPVSVLFTALVTYLVIRSVRQMDLAIRRLGAGDWGKPIRVAGPRDMEYLGERLDWLRSRLQALENARQQFFRHLSHELKTPLASIHEGTELLADEVVGELNTEQRDITKIMVGSTHKLDSMIADLINYSQVNLRPSAERRILVEAVPLVSSVVEDNQIRLRAKSIQVASDLKPVRVEGNPEQLRTIVDNLLSNAIKYSPPGGEIRLRLGSRSGQMELEIEDDGPGIPEDERRQIFEPFFQGSAARDGRVGGTGLGLAIVDECVASHRGKVEALPPRPERSGARIRVSIPCRQRD
jgi:two-component system sensor histidine kinase GlrK